MSAESCLASEPGAAAGNVLCMVLQRHHFMHCCIVYSLSHLEKHASISSLGCTAHICIRLPLSLCFVATKGHDCTCAPLYLDSNWKSPTREVMHSPIKYWLHLCAHVGSSEAKKCLIVCIWVWSTVWRKAPCGGRHLVEEGSLLVKTKRQYLIVLTASCLPPHPPAVLHGLSLMSSKKSWQ